PANRAGLGTDERPAEKASPAALGIGEDLVGRSPDEPIYRDNLAQTLRDQAMFQKRLGKLREGIATIDRAKALADALADKLRPSSFHRTLGTILLDPSDLEYLLGPVDAAQQSSPQAGRLPYP